MARTTLNIDAPILKELKRLQQEQGKPLGRLASELLAEALDRRKRAKRGARFHWETQPMRARVDLADKDAVWAALDEHER